MKALLLLLENRSSPIDVSADLIVGGSRSLRLGHGHHCSLSLPFSANGESNDMIGLFLGPGSGYHSHRKRQNDRESDDNAHLTHSHHRMLGKRCRVTST
jgi:hypothetical protein